MNGRMILQSTSKQNIRMLFSAPPLRSLRLSGKSFAHIHRRDAEDAEETQRRTMIQESPQLTQSTPTRLQRANRRALGIQQAR